MMKRSGSILGVLALVAALAAPAWADSIHIGGTETITNQGGAGGAGGSASSSAAAAASATSNPVQVNTQVTEQEQHQKQHQQQQQGQLQGQKQGQNNKQVIAPSQTVNEGDTPAQAPAIFSPNLTSSPEACMGSISGGGGAGFNGVSFGFNLGSTWTNQECQDRMNARTLSALGQNQAALEYLAAANPKIADALKRAGVKVSALEAAPTVALAVPAPVVEQGGTKVEKRDVAKADGPLCGDQKPAKLVGWRYSCAYAR